MQVYLTEKIGDPDLFTGRRKELAFFLKWVEGVKRQHSKSMAILSRRKTGKTALLQRLYNLIFHQNEVWTVARFAERFTCHSLPKQALALLKMCVLEYEFMKNM